MQLAVGPSVPSLLHHSWGQRDSGQCCLVGPQSVPCSGFQMDLGGGARWGPTARSPLRPVFWGHYCPTLQDWVYPSALDLALLDFHPRYNSLSPN